MADMEDTNGVAQPSSAASAASAASAPSSPVIDQRRVITSMAEIPQTIPFAHPHLGIHLMTTCNTTVVSSKARAERIQFFARNIIRGINDPQNANVYFCGSHAPVSYVQCVWAPVNTDEEFISKEAAAMLAACSIVPRPASCTCDAPADEGSCIGGGDARAGCTEACQLCSARALVERFRESVVRIMENVQQLLGTSSGCIVAAGAAAASASASGEGGEGNGAIRFPNFCCGESTDVLRWVNDQSKWVIAMYHTFHTMGGLEPMSDTLMLEKELASFVSKMQVHSQFMLLTVLKEMCALRERYDAISADSERDEIIVQAVVRWICKLQVGCDLVLHASCAQVWASARQERAVKPLVRLWGPHVCRR
jgi:hypothetical protein